MRAKVWRKQLSLATTLDEIASVQEAYRQDDLPDELVLRLDEAAMSERERRSTTSGDAGDDEGEDSEAPVFEEEAR